MSLVSDASLGELALLPIAIDRGTTSRAWKTTLRLAERFSLSMYGQAHLELAERCRRPLATLDLERRRAALAAGVALPGAV